MPDAEGIRLLAVITQRAQNARTMAAKKDKAREDRIVMEIVVDAYGPEERAMGWYCHLDNTMSFPFTAQCTGKRATSPLKKGDEVAVIGVAPEDDCQNEMFVTIRWEEDDLAVPLSQLEPVRASAASRQAVEDWLYWVKMGYEYYLFKDQGDSTGNVGPAPETHKRQQLKLGKGVTFVKSHLRRLPQSAEIWEADIRPAPAPGNKRMIWEGLVISHDGRMPSERMFEEPATVNDMAVLLADAMRRPTDGEPRRPKTLRIRKRKEWADLLPHLKQIGIQVISAPRLASWDKVFKAICRNAAKEPDLTPEEARIEDLYPAIAEFVRSQGHIEIGDQQGIGFVARALNHGGVVFDGPRAKTLAEAMTALEVGIADWFERECLSDD
jgi:hypothetical protein